MKRWLIVAIISLCPAIAMAKNPRYPFPKTESQVWQNDLDLQDSLDSRISKSSATICLDSPTLCVDISKHAVSAGTTTAQANIFLIYMNSNSSANTLLIQNDGTGASSDAAISLQSSSAGGDDRISFYNGAGDSGGSVWSFGQDTSDSEKIKLNRNNVLGSANDFWEMDINGNNKRPAQPDFRAQVNAASASVTGNGRIYTIQYGNEIYDQGGNFVTSTFTAPVDGKYEFGASVDLNTLTVAHTKKRIDIVVNGATSCTNYIDGEAVAYTNKTLSVTCEISLSATDKVAATTSVSGGTQTVSVENDGPTSIFWGHLEN